MGKLKTIIRLLKEAGAGWTEDKISVHGAALAFYTIFSIAPLLIIIIAIAGLAFGEQASKGQIFSAIQGLVGEYGARSIQAFVHSAASEPRVGLIASVIGLATLLIGASEVFAQLQESLNTIWGVATKPGKGNRVFIRRRLLTFSMIIAIGFLLLVTLVISAGLAALGQFVGARLPGGFFIWQVVNALVSFTITTLLFGAILKILPDVNLEWRDVWLGAAVTALLFTVGKLLIGLYLGHSGIASTYGAAGSLVVVLLWVYYASQILLFGAEFTRAYTVFHGRSISAKAGSTLLAPREEKARAA
jgi:membrane protein